MTEHKFHRLHIPSGNLTEGTFNVSHSYVFANGANYSIKTVEHTKLSLMNRWNAIHPKDWKYWI